METFYWKYLRFTWTCRPLFIAVHFQNLDPIPTKHIRLIVGTLRSARRNCSSRCIGDCGPGPCCGYVDCWLRWLWTCDTITDNCGQLVCGVVVVKLIPTLSHRCAMPPGEMWHCHLQFPVSGTRGPILLKIIDLLITHPLEVTWTWIHFTHFMSTHADSGSNWCEPCFRGDKL